VEDRRKDNFKKLFHPSSIAVVGASADTQKLGGGRCFVYLKKSYRGNLYPVNPKYTDMLGVPCYPSLKDVPGKVDLAVLSLPAKQIGGALRECVAQGIKAVCIFSSGFAEVGGSGMEMQREIEALAKKNELCVLGPNCEGYYNIQESIPATFSTSAEKEIPGGKIALISQRGPPPWLPMRRSGIGRAWDLKRREKTIPFCCPLEFVRAS
jgi:acetyltransferase